MGGRERENGEDEMGGDRLHDEGFILLFPMNGWMYV